MTQVNETCPGCVREFRALIGGCMANEKSIETWTAHVSLPPVRTKFGKLTLTRDLNSDLLPFWPNVHHLELRSPRGPEL
jgi:hypothetical protein